MKRQVTITDLAFDELDDAFVWWSKHRSSEQALAWYNGFIAAIKNLADTAEQWALAAENEEFPYEIRQLNYGAGKHRTHRAVYTIRPDMVLVLRVRHLAQDAIKP